METIFMNSRISKTYDPHRLLLNLLDKKNIKRSHRYVTLSNLSIYYTWKNIKKLMNLKHQLRNRVKSLNYLIHHILYQMFKTILNVPWRKHGEKTDNHPIRIYLNKIENRITFKIKTKYYLELLMNEAMKLLGSNKSRINKDKNG